MHHLSSYLIGGLLTALAIDGISGGIAMPGWALVSDMLPGTSTAAVNRNLKGDRLATTGGITKPPYRNVKLAGQLDTFTASADPLRAILFNPTPMTGSGRGAQSFGGSIVGMG